MQAYFQFHSKLGSFRTFSFSHIMTIGIILVLSILLFVFRKRIKENRRIYGVLLASFLFLVDLSQHVWLVYENAWSVKSELPLHLSDLAVILAIIMLLTRSNALFQFMYFAGLGSSVQAIVTPDLGKFPFPHFQYLAFFALHGSVVFACLFMLVAFEYRPTVRSMWITILIVNLYAGAVFLLNKAIGSNYLYIMKKPPNTSVLDLLGRWPWYLLSVELVMILSFYLLYIPFWVRKK